VLDTAQELMRRKALHIKLVMVGSGSAKPRLMARAQREKLDTILFLDALPKTKLAGLMASADVGLQLLANQPSLHESVNPTTFFDYIASGTPVICNYTGWVAEIITLHQCGWVVAGDDASSLADALVYAANNRVELAAMGPRAQQLARTAFARDQVAEMFCQCLEGMV
jgi:glycosyltransferase involved in cell wall biosynthesis